MKKYKSAALIILDGFGLSDKIKGNAVKNAKADFINGIFKEYPFTSLKAHGKDVGLPNGTMGNSEVGHSNIGAGRILMQDLTKINDAIENDTLKNNPVLLNFVNSIKQGNGRVHLMGLVSESGVHAELSHLIYLINFFYENNAKEIYIHCFLDGRDSPPKSSGTFLKKLTDAIGNRKDKISIATAIGRFYAMDRDTRWDRVQLAFNMLTKAEGKIYDDVFEAINDNYSHDITDEFITPSIIKQNNGNRDGRIHPEDGVLFINYRADRAKEITKALSLETFNFFDRNSFKPVKNFITMAKYDDSFKNKYIVEPQNYKNILGEVISDSGLKQFRIAETEKYAHVTYFFNCGREEPFKNEDRLLIPSPREYRTYDLIPEMSAFKIKDALIEKLKLNEYSLSVCNFANCDMVGHTGNYDAAVKAVETVNSALSEIIPVILKNDGVCIVTADHGNAETMIDDNGAPMTNHTLNPVPLCIVSNYKNEIPPLKPGRLSDIAPTILSLLDINIPAEMTGRVLWE
ncbi:MAG: 2,3-bisphosphoglycerate-independent phosphoglycerate mutase [Candidatus Acididesulfobacter guangdongensis]|uniref:2,3-bisphosphoglycerate-independent phosphoglycerate mutase n=1 Tax=Acididesulfobacter guangdongensis TaxID=2597225 RepID=A0A519BI54_ACIG2|nr:MAG: 2,3-bisphosphoglycerate-independent phosphoglycerate mutase [Candidatus Acididesulfobacter guangdongensis]